jgi:hypothetical protein
VRSEERRQLAPLGSSPDDDRPCARVGHARGQQQADRTGAEDGDVVSLLDAGDLDAV